MSLFAELLCKHFPTVTFPSVNHTSISKLDNTWKYSSIHHTSVKLIYYIYFLPYSTINLNNKSSYKNKFHILNDIILKNIYLSVDETNFFFEKFSKAQNTYNAFRKLSYIYKYKYSKRFEIDGDLCFNSFSEFSQKITISLIEDNVIYKFRISDLLNIINRSLSNSPNFFSEPLEIRNPYTNLPFKLSNLYNIYFKIKETNYIMPTLLQQYFTSNFDLIRFKNYNECFIRDKCIENFMRDASTDDKYYYIMKMFYIHYKSIYFKLDPYFPRTTTVNVFKHYLHSFLLEEYSLNPYVRETNKIQLDYNLTLFSQLNPEFGKKIWIRKRSSTNNYLSYNFYDTVNTSFNNIITPNSLQSTYIHTSNEIAEEQEYIDSEISHQNEEQYEDENNNEHFIFSSSSTIANVLLTSLASYHNEENEILSNYQEPTEGSTILTENDTENDNSTDD